MWTMLEYVCAHVPAGAAAFIAGMAIKGAAILAVALLVALAIRRSASSARHIVIAAGLCGTLALPISTLLVPSVNLPVLPARISSTATAAPADGATTTISTAEPAVSAAPQVAAAPSASSRLSGRSAAPRLDWPAIIAVIWAVGAIAAIVPLFVALIALLRITHAAQLLTGPDWFKPLGEALATLRLRHPVRLMESRRVTVPMTWGFLRPVVLLPVSASQWFRGRRRVVLLHELSHIERWDYLTQTCGRLACVFHWFNPLAWYAFRKMLALREQACDDRVLSAGAMPSDYAGHLLEIARSVGAMPAGASAAILMARKGKTASRVETILATTSIRRALSMKEVSLYLVATICLLVPLSLIHAVAAEVKASGEVKAAAPTILKHDTGTMKSHASIAGGGHFIRFECASGKWFLTGIQIYGSRYGTFNPPKDAWTITLCDPNLKAVKAIKKPYSIFERTAEGKWYSIDLPALELPSKDGAPLPFWINVDFNPQATKGVYVGYDGSSDETYSKVGLPGSEAGEMRGRGEWMIRAIVTQRPTEKVSEDLGRWAAPGGEVLASLESEGLVELSNDGGKSTGRQSIGGEGPVATFTCAADGATLERIRIYASRYGANYDPASTPVLFYILDDKGDAISNGFFPYATFDFQPKWVEVKVTPVKVPKSFSILINPNATQSQGIFFHYDATGAQKPARAGASPESIEDMKGAWNWMIRAGVRIAGK